VLPEVFAHTVPGLTFQSDRAPASDRGWSRASPGGVDLCGAGLAGRAG